MADVYRRTIASLVCSSDAAASASFVAFPLLLRIAGRLTVFARSPFRCCRFSVICCLSAFFEFTRRRELLARFARRVHPPPHHSYRGTTAFKHSPRSAARHPRQRTSSRDTSILLVTRTRLFYQSGESTVHSPAIEGAKFSTCAPTMLRPRSNPITRLLFGSGRPVLYTIPPAIVEY